MNCKLKKKDKNRIYLRKEGDHKNHKNRKKKNFFPAESIIRKIT